MDFDLPDLSDVLEARELPRLPGVGGLVDAAAENHVRANRLAAGADVDDVWIRVGDVDRADRSRRDLSVGRGEPGDAEVLGLPHAAAARAHVEHVRLRADAGDGRRAAAAVRPDLPPAHVLIRPGIGDRVWIRLPGHG